MAHDSTALVVASPSGELDTPLPLFTGEQMAAAFVAYRELQAALDRAMPDQIMQLDGKAYRKKGYWRAVAVAFHLNVEPVEERDAERGEFHDGRPNFGYHVTYCAQARTGGRKVYGDGSCFASEKARKFRCPHPHATREGKSEHWPHDACPDYDPEFRWRELPEQATDHNVRGHAHTRAFNRAVSNHVGFGEVSFEEAFDDDGDDDSRAPPPPRTSRPGLITEPQRKRLWAISHRAKWHEDATKALIQRYGFAHDNEITRAKYDEIVRELERGPK